MNAGIVVEGPDDVVVYRALMKRIEPAIEHVHARECGGRQKLKNKFVQFLNEFTKNPAAFNIERVIVIRDSDCNNAGPIETALSDTFESSRLKPAFGVKFHATKCKLESWLLADEAAINTVSLRRGGPGGIARVEADLESLKESDTLYRSLLSRAHLLDTGAVMEEIAREARIEVIRERCPAFRHFENKVRD